ncbi:MHJ_0274 family protein [Mycoplasmopsis hyopharyngis]|uniref:MHJ_0274 family protein n=1 Tax=Mycoplasmopsis hyopharyngis TaxID=29558 RepID=UPI003872BC37
MIEANLTFYNNTANSSSNALGFTGGSITWVILGVVIAGLIAVFIFASIKDAVNRKKLKRIRKENAEKMQRFTKYLIIYMNELLQINQKYLDEFEPSIGKLKMNQIINGAKQSLNELMNNEEFKNLIKNGEAEYAQIINKISLLNGNRSNNWSKKCAEIIEFFTKSYTDIDPMLYKEEIKSAKEAINKIYDDQINVLDNSNEQEEMETNER